MNKSRFDVNHIKKLTFDEKSLANRVTVVGTEFNLSLNSDEGDNVESRPSKLVASILGCTEEDNGSIIIPALDCKNLREVHVSIEGTGSVIVWVSPTDKGDFFYQLGGSDQILSVCARRIKVQSVNVVGTVHLVGRS